MYGTELKRQVTGRFKTPSLLFFGMFSYLLVLEDASATGMSVDHPLLSGSTFYLDDLRRHCIEIPELTIGTEEEGAWVAACSVTNLVRFARFEGLDYYRAHYCLSPHYLIDLSDRGCGTYPAAAQAIFVGHSDSESVRLFAVQDGDFTQSYGEPAIVSTRSGQILHVNVRVTGTGHFNTSDYYLWSGADWDRIESEQWTASLQAFLDAPSAEVPRGLGMRKGIWPDLATMTATISLYFARDCNACASGGLLEVTLGIEGGRFVAESIRYVVPEAEQNDPAH